MATACWVIPIPSCGNFGAERVEITNKIAHAFEILALDTAVLARAGSVLSRVPSQSGERKQCLKVDALIVACAVSGNCDLILSGDPDIADIADGLIAVSEPPDTAVEQDLGFE